jgi:hypothetical protein
MIVAHGKGGTSATLGNAAFRNFSLAPSDEERGRVRGGSGLVTVRASTRRHPSRHTLTSLGFLKYRGVASELEVSLPLCL